MAEEYNKTVKSESAAAVDNQITRKCKGVRNMFFVYVQVTAY